MRREEAHFERAMILARLHLSRGLSGDRLRSFESHEVGYGFLHTRILPWEGKEFGVVVLFEESRSAIGSSCVDYNALTLRPEIQGKLESIRDRLCYLPYPLLFIIVNVKTDRAHYGWLQKLPMQPEVAYPWEDSRSASDIVKTVEGWYSLRRHCG